MNISKGLENASIGLALVGRRVGEREMQEAMAAREENFLRMRQQQEEKMEGVRHGNDMARDEKNFEKQKAFESDRRTYETGENDKQFGRQRQLEGERRAHDDARYDKDELRRLRGEQAARMGEVDSLLSDLNKEAQETLRSIAESGSIDLSSAEGVKQAWGSPLMAPYASQRDRLEKAKDGIRKEYAVRLGDAGDPYAAGLGSDAPPPTSSGGAASTRGGQGEQPSARPPQVVPVAGKRTTVPSRKPELQFMVPELETGGPAMTTQLGSAIGTGVADLVDYAAKGIDEGEAKRLEQIRNSNPAMYKAELHNSQVQAERRRQRQLIR